MTKIATTKMSSKGQIVIPENIRKDLGLTTGIQFVVVGAKDCVILKAVVPPKMEEFGDLMAESRRQAKAIGLKPNGVQGAIKRARKSR
jgi:AbrB family looped-hinge helix DNA binding protein